jgi:D-sedoheptulose 7-phosphate isomerase
MSVGFALPATEVRPSLATDVLSAHVLAVRKALAEIELDAINRIVDVIRAARDRGAYIYIAGNGGSSATASHWVNDLGKATKRSGCPPLKVMCLSDNTPWLLALSNDEGYERAFAGQLENFGAPGDVLICISASGNSPNLLQAAKLSHARKMTTVVLVGFDGGSLKGSADEAVWVKTAKDAYELVEDVHSVICHAITRCLIADRPRRPLRARRHQ